MAAAATNFLDALTPELRAKAMLPFADQGRMDWHYVPRERIGVAPLRAAGVPDHGMSSAS